VYTKQESDESFADDDSEEDASGDGSDAESEEEGMLTHKSTYNAMQL
jgi:hypothetical protein